MNKLKVEPCPRCKGRMLVDGASGDLACFVCGHVLYGGLTPEPMPLPKLERRPTHGGQRLD